MTRTFYTEDVSCPLSYEPSGYDFLSPCLQEAELMSRYEINYYLLRLSLSLSAVKMYSNMLVLSRILVEEEEFVAWLENFLPQLFDETFVLVPGEVNDPFDLCISLWLCLSV